MQDADLSTIHYIVNSSLNTTTKLQMVLGTLSVTTTEYVSKEEHDASEIGNGQVLSEDFYNMETGEKITVKSYPDAGIVDNDALIAAVKEAIEDQVGSDDKIMGVDFDGSDIYITITIGQPNSEYITKKDIAESRISSVTNAILDLDDKYFNTWETITLDFGEEGKATFKKEDVKDQGLGKFFQFQINKIYTKHTTRLALYLSARRVFHIYSTYLSKCFSAIVKQYTKMHPICTQNGNLRAIVKECTPRVHR